jgi:hypothetical protein
MNKPPRLAMAILMRLGPREEPLVGDLVEEYTTGRSRLWFWRQALAAVAAGAIRGIRDQPLRAVGAAALGWAVLGLVFVPFGDRAANGLAKLVWNWNRAVGYGSNVWWPFQIAAAFVSYAGFALSAFVVARLHRGNPAMLLAYVTSVAIALVAGAVAIEVLTYMYDRVPLPHPLFYVVSLTLPYHWRSGLLLVPGIMLVCGLLAGRSRPGDSQEIRRSRD